MHIKRVINDTVRLLLQPVRCSRVSTCLRQTFDENSHDFCCAGPLQQVHGSQQLDAGRPLVLQMEYEYFNHRRTVNSESNKKNLKKNRSPIHLNSVACRRWENYFSDQKGPRNRAATTAMLQNRITSARARTSSPCDVDSATGRKSLRQSNTRILSRKRFMQTQ